MKHVLIILLTCIATGQLLGQSDTVYQNRDTSNHVKDNKTRKYLVCETRWGMKPSKIFEDGAELEISDTMGEKRWGKLKILDSEFLELDAGGRRDTFHISAVYQVSKLTTEKIGIRIMGAIGVLTLTILVPPAGILLAVLLFKQNRYRHWDYVFHITQTQGFVLTKRHLKYIY